MTTPPLCTALITVIHTWRAHEAAVAESERVGELTMDEIAARQNHSAALEQLERAARNQVQEAAV